MQERFSQSCPEAVYDSGQTKYLREIFRMYSRETSSFIALAIAWSSMALAKNNSNSAQAPQLTGTPGSPGATTTIDGRYLPPPSPRFGGAIGLQADQSKPYWPARVAPPKGAPNILLIMTDDQG